MKYVEYLEQSSTVQKKKKFQPKYLLPKVSDPRYRRYAVIDIEANEWIKFEMLAFFDGVNRKIYSSLRSCLEDILCQRYRGWWIYGHYAGGYDWNFVLQELNDFFRHEGYTYKTINQGSKILQIRVKKGKNSWYFVDSSSLLSSSLDSLCKTFKTTTQKMVGSIDFDGGEKVSAVNDTHRAYATSDARALHEIIEKYQEDPKVKEDGLALTAASQALGMFRRTIKSPIRVSPQFSSDFVRKGYVGGRVEIFKMQGTGLQYYDVNSLFPFAMRYNRMPLEFISEQTTLPDDDTLYFADVTVKSPDLYIPILPLKTESKLVFPNGTFRGVFFSEELKLALEYGYKILSVHEVHTYSSTTDLFSEYVDYWYNVKKTAEKGGADEYRAKLNLNGLYGKFGQNEKRSHLALFDDIDPFKDEWKMFHSEKLFNSTGLVEVASERRSPHMLPHLSAATTSYSRIHMLRSCYLKNPEGVYYTDTDSCLTTDRLPTGDEIGELKLESKRPDEVIFPDGKRLMRSLIKNTTEKNGQMLIEYKREFSHKKNLDKVLVDASFKDAKEALNKKLVMEDCTADFLRPKGYEIRTRSGQIVDRKMKGIPQKFIKSLESEKFLTHDYVYQEEQVLRARRSLISTGKFLSTWEVEKRIIGEYTKRRIVGGGNTEPWVIKDGELQK